MITCRLDSARISPSLFIQLIYLLSAASYVRSIATVPIPNEHARHIKTKFDDYSEHFLLPDDFETAARTPGNFH